MSNTVPEPHSLTCAWSLRELRHEIALDLVELSFLVEELRSYEEQFDEEDLDDASSGLEMIP